jgi:hypothetical protein
VDGVCVGLEEVPQTLRVPSNLDRVRGPLTFIFVIKEVIDCSAVVMPGVR